MNASIGTIGTMKAVRVDGKITKVKQPQDQSNSTMGDLKNQLNKWHLHYGKLLQIMRDIPLS